MASPVSASTSVFVCIAVVWKSIRELSCSSVCVVGESLVTSSSGLVIWGSMKIFSVFLFG